MQNTLPFKAIDQHGFHLGKRGRSEDITALGQVFETTHTAAYFSLAKHEVEVGAASLGVGAHFAIEAMWLKG